MSEQVWQQPSKSRTERYYEFEQGYPVASVEHYGEEILELIAKIDDEVEDGSLSS